MNPSLNPKHVWFPVDDVQLSCYRILTSLYALGTGKNIYMEKYGAVDN